jgi:hypothetical protein
MFISFLFTAQLLFNLAYESIRRNQRTVQEFRGEGLLELGFLCHVRLSSLLGISGDLILKEKERDV